MTVAAATEPLGDRLRIAPAFVATATNDVAGIETGIEAHYVRSEGRYVVRTIVNRATRDDFDQDALRRISIAPIMQAAVPHCIAFEAVDVDLWTTVADTTAEEGRLVSPFIAVEVVKRGMKEERMAVVSLIYGATALAGLPPVQAVARELDVPHRTASDWIMKARKAGYLEGMAYIVGRQPER
ncbi:hypothetical protein ACFC1I_13920 [Microbacterium sp. NPDC056044]|uniref:hypothetical protein n=1 Tax=unclassified Microbacterium TaxID=2609290 RepID=UPI0035E1D96C